MTTELLLFWGLGGLILVYLLVLIARDLAVSDRLVGARARWLLMSLLVLGALGVAQVLYVLEILVPWHARRVVSEHHLAVLGQALSRYWQREHRLPPSLDLLARAEQLPAHLLYTRPEDFLDGSFQLGEDARGWWIRDREPYGVRVWWVRREGRYQVRAGPGDPALHWVESVREEGEG